MQRTTLLGQLRQAACPAAVWGTMSAVEAVNLADHVELFKTVSHPQRGVLVASPDIQVQVPQGGDRPLWLTSDAVWLRCDYG